MNIPNTNIDTSLTQTLSYQALLVYNNFYIYLFHLSTEIYQTLYIYVVKNLLFDANRNELFQILNES